MTEATKTRAKNTRRKAERVPISGQNDPLEVNGKDPDFYYRWVLDKSEKGTNILKHERAGYVFAEKSEGLIIGSSSVYVNDHVGSFIRVPAGKSGENMYLMKQPMEYREEDLGAKATTVNATEERLQAGNEADGRYGRVKIER